MTFQKLIAVVAVFGLAAEAHAAGGLRREETIAQIEASAAPVSPGVVAPEAPKVIETTQVVEVKQVEVKQLDVKTPVEAEAVTKADQLRKARETEEVHTEQKIVEKLEASRLSEEQKRAEKLFGDKTNLDQAAPAPPTVRIEKVEIVQPATIVAPPPAPVAQPAPVTPIAPIVVAPKANSTAAQELAAEEAAEEQPVAQATTYYVGGNVAAPNYDSSRVKSNYGLGATVGMMVGDEYAIEGSFNYSNFYVNNVWSFPLYREMDQYEVQAAFKYYLFHEVLHGRVKPFVGVSGSYIYREYTDRQLQQYSYNSNQTTQNTNSFNVGALVGVDFAVTNRFSIGGQFEYSHPIMSKNDFDLSTYGINNGQTKVEEWDFTTLKLTAKFSF